MILTSGITRDERSRVFAFIPLFIGSAVFWSLYQQQFTVVTIYSDERLDRSIGGFEMPVSWVQSINPIMIIVLSGVFAALWTKLGDRQPSTPTKFALGTGIMGLAFLLFLPFTGTGRNGTPVLVLVGILLVFTLAELLLSPDRPVRRHEARAAEVPDADGRAVLPVGVARHRGDRGAVEVLRPRERGAVLHRCSAWSPSSSASLLLVLAKPVLRLMRGIR